MAENLPPKMFRTMLHDHADGHPRVGSEPDMLGVRTGPDARPDSKGNVGPGRGMSVAPEWYLLPDHKIPARLGSKLPNGIPRTLGGDENCCIWRMGEGPFNNGAVVATGLSLCVSVKKPRHGQVEPAGVMPLQEFSDRLAGTRDAWRPIDEDPECLAKRR